MKIAKCVFWLCTIVAVVLLVVGFILPPTGVIDNSVLTAVGELFGFAVLGQLPTMIHGHNVELTHGNTSLSIEQDNSNS